MGQLQHVQGAVRVLVTLPFNTPTPEYDSGAYVSLEPAVSLSCLSCNHEKPRPHRSWERGQYLLVRLAHDIRYWQQAEVPQHLIPCIHYIHTIGRALGAQLPHLHTRQAWQEAHAVIRCALTVAGPR